MPDQGGDSCKGAGRLQGKAALITGDDDGIGRVVAIAIAREALDLFAYRIVRETGSLVVALEGRTRGDAIPRPPDTRTLT